MNTATSSSISSTLSPSNATASASPFPPPPLVLKPSYNPPTDPDAMAPRLQGDVKDMCFCGEPAEDGYHCCSLGIESYNEWLLQEMEHHEVKTAMIRAQLDKKAQEAQKAQEAKKTHAVEDICPCGKPTEDDLPYCSLACECQAKYEEDEQWQAYQAAKMKQEAEGH